MLPSCIYIMWLCTWKVWSCYVQQLGGDSFTREYFIWPWPQGYMSCCPVPSTMYLTMRLTEISSQGCRHCGLLGFVHGLNTTNPTHVLSIIRLFRGSMLCFGLCGRESNVMINSHHSRFKKSWEAAPKTAPGAVSKVRLHGSLETGQKMAPGSQNPPLRWGYRLFLTFYMYIMWPIHLQSFNFNIAQYPLHHVNYASAKFEVATNVHPTVLVKIQLQERWQTEEGQT